MACALFVSLAWLLSLCLHEFCHALVAYAGGDKSVKDKGYLTFNPIKYTDLGLTLIVPLLMLMLGAIGLPGAAVYINRGALRNRLWASAVSAAGPFGSVLATLLFAIPFLLNWDIQPEWLRSSLAFLILLEIVSVILNSLPFPPLDGYGVIEPWLPGPIRRSVNRIGPGSVWILFALLWFVPPVNDALWVTSFVIADLLNVPREAMRDGYHLFKSQALYLVLVIILLSFLSRRKARQ